MSRTHAHTPYHVHARRDPNAEVVHDGCHLDPEGQGRVVRWEEVEVFEDADWRPRRLQGQFNWYDLTPTLYAYNGELQCYVKVGSDKPKVELLPKDLKPVRGTRTIYAPLRYLKRVPVYEVVPCDLDDSSLNRWRSCHYDSDTASQQAYGYHHKCDWHGLQRDLWYKPERQQGREFCREAAAIYNTTGEAPEDEPYVPGSPSGLWGGGWVD